MIAAVPGYRGYPPPVTRQRIPDEVLTAAHDRARAREARDWAEADRLRESIEAAGWKIVDRGTDFALSPATPPDIAEGEQVRYGSSLTVPSRLADAPVGVATVVLVATDWPDDLDRALSGPAGGFTTRNVGRRRGRRTVRRSRRPRWWPSRRRPRATCRSRSSGRATAWATVRRPTSACAAPRGPVVILLDTSVEPTGDIVTPLVRALDDPTVAVAGGWGIVSADLRHFEEAPAGDVDAIEGYCQAFRRADYASAARWTSASASTAISTSGGASSCATRAGRGAPTSRRPPRRPAARPPRAPRLHQPARGRARSPEQAQLLPDHRSVRPAPRPAGPPRLTSVGDLVAPALSRRAAEPSTHPAHRRPPSPGRPARRAGRPIARSRDPCEPAARSATRLATASGRSTGTSGGVLPDSMEVQPEHEVRIEDQPAPFLLRERCADDLAQERERDRHVQVVVDGGNEAVVQVAAGRRERGRGIARAVVRRIAGATPVPARADGDADRTVAGRTGDQRRRRRPGSLSGEVRPRPGAARGGTRAPTQPRGGTARSTPASDRTSTSGSGSGTRVDRCRDR